MNLDLLITKYIDSELTIEEDFDLRSQISQNKLAKDTFDDFISIHLAMQEEANEIKVPEDISVATEDMILMKILAKAPVTTAKVVRLRRNVFTYIASLAALFLLFNTLVINDLKTDNSKIKLFDNNLISNINKVSENDKSSVAGINNKIKSGINKINKSIKQNIAIAHGFDLQQNNNQTNVVYSNNINSEKLLNNSILNSNVLSDGSLLVYDTTNKNEPNIKKTDLNSSKIIETENSISTENTPTQTNENINYEQNSLNSNKSLRNNSNNELLDISNNDREFYIFNDNKNKTTIHLATFISNSMLCGGVNSKQNKSITNISQSFGFTINENNKIGVEIGLIDYPFEESIQILVPIKTPTLSNIKHPVINGYSPLDLVNSFQTKYIVQKRMSIMWGAAFYENSLIHWSDFSLYSRFGIGATDQGGISYSKFYGKYEIVNRISLTVGTEGFLLLTQPPVDSYGDKKWKSSLSMIYGLQFSF